MDSFLEQSKPPVVIPDQEHPVHFVHESEQQLEQLSVWLRDLDDRIHDDQMKSALENHHKSHIPPAALKMHAFLERAWIRMPKEVCCG